jgi:trypsin
MMKASILLGVAVICSTASAVSLRASDASDEKPTRRLNIHTDSFITDIVGVIKTETFREGAASSGDQQQQSDQLELLLKPRLVGKSTINPGEYPYFCRIDKNFFPSCAGTLVAPDVVLTNAANCKADDPSQLRVLVNGLHDDIHLVIPDERYRAVTDMKVHPDFSSDTYYNDLMLLKLSEPIKDDIPFVELNRDSARPALDEPVTVMGLGALYKGRSYPDLLQSVEVDMISNDFCSAAYEDVGLFSVDKDIMLCAGKRVGAPGNACQRDAGGPLLNKDGVQVGVMSYGLGCEREEFPGGMLCR